MTPYLHLLRNKPFRNFFLSNVLLDLGKKLSWVALSWFVYQITGSAYSIGIVVTTSTVAPVISSLLVGSLLDRYNRRNLLVLENLFRGMILALIPLLHAMGLLSLPIVVCVVFANGFLSSFTTVGSQTILPSFVKEDELEVANAVSSMTSQAGYLLGPAIGGFCTGWFGSPATILINVACFFIASLLFSRIPDAVWQKGVERSEQQVTFGGNLLQLVQETRAGIRFLLRHRALLMVAAVTFWFNVVYGPLEPMLPVYADQVLQSGPETIGTMWTFFAVGSFVGAMLWIRWNKPFSYSYALGGVIILWGLATLGIGLSPNRWCAFAVMLIGGVLYAPYNIVAPTLKQRLVPNELRGRVFSVLGLLSSLGLPIGVYLGGLMGSVAGPVLTILSAGAACVALGVGVAAHPALRFRQGAMTGYGEEMKEAS